MEGKHRTKGVEEGADPGRRRGAPAAAAPPAPAPADGGEPLIARTVPVEVDGRRFDVKVWLPESPEPPAGGGAAPARGQAPPPAPSPAARGRGPAGPARGPPPLPGTIVKTPGAGGRP